MSSVITISNIGGTPTEFNFYYDKTNTKINTNGPVAASNLPYEIIVQSDNPAWEGNCITVRVESADNSNCNLTKTFCCATTASGTVFKDEIYNARVFLKESDSMTYETANYKTTTDITGSYTLTIPSNITSARIVAAGGIDVKTGVQLGNSYEFENNVNVTQGTGTVSVELNVATTIISKFKKSFPALDTSIALKKLGLEGIDIDSTNPQSYHKTNAKLNSVGALLSNNSKENFTKFVSSIASDIAASSDAEVYGFITDSSLEASKTELTNIVKKVSSDILSISTDSISTSDALTVTELAASVMTNIQTASDEASVIKAIKYAQTGGFDGSLQSKVLDILDPNTDSVTKLNSSTSVSTATSQTDMLIGLEQVTEFNASDPDAITKLEPVAGGNVTTTTTTTATTTTYVSTTESTSNTTTSVPTTTPLAVNNTSATTTNTTVEYTTTNSTTTPAGPSITTSSATTTTNTTVTTNNFVGITTTTNTTTTGTTSTSTSNSTTTTVSTSTTTTEYIPVTYSSTTTDGPPSITTTTSVTTNTLTTTTNTTAVNTEATSTTTTASDEIDSSSALTSALVGREIKMLTSDLEPDLNEDGYYFIDSVTPESSTGAEDAEVNVDGNTGTVMLQEVFRGSQWVLVNDRSGESPV